MKKTFLAILAAAISLVSAADRLQDKVLAYFELRNAIAAEILSGDEEAVEKAMKKATAFRMETTAGTLRCDVCKGANPFVVVEPDHGQNTGRIKKSEMLGQHKVTCPACAGKGTLFVYLPADTLENAFTAAYAMYEAKKLSEGLVKTNGAFFATAEIAKASAPQMQAIALAMGDVCRRCKGSGIGECRKCKGEGTVKCRNSGCKEGWLKTQKRNTSKTKYPPTFKPCVKCCATEKLPCSECSGRRARKCKDCSGEGVTRKKR